jgi:TolB-like protein
MKKLIFPMLAMFAVSVLFSCGSSAPAVSGKKSGNREYFTGDGGQDKSLAVLIPTGNGLSAAQNYLPRLVQGVLVGDISKYSSIQVLDRVSLDNMLAETESGVYQNEDDFIQLGKIANVGYVMTGEIIKTSSGYNLSITVSDTITGTTAASYSGACSVRELDNHTGIKKASMELLSQMGVNLTAEARRELEEEDKQDAIQAQTALAQGITAERSGSTIAALNFFSEAASFDAGFPEANARLSAISQVIEGGNIGENARNELQQRKEWDKLLDEALEFYQSYPVFDIVWNTEAQQGKIDFQEETVDVVFELWLEPNIRLSTLMEIARALENTGKVSEWGLDSKLVSLVSSYEQSSSMSSFYKMGVKAELLDAAGDFLAEGCVGNWDDDRKGFADHLLLYAYRGDGRGFTIDADKPIVIGTPQVLHFFDVDANRMTDEVSVNITEAGKLMRRGPVCFLNENALQNIRFIATDKNYNDYFKGRREYKFNGTFWSYNHLAGNL